MDKTVKKTEKISNPNESKSFEQYKNSKKNYLGIKSDDTNNDHKISKPVSVQKLAAAFETIGKLGEKFANVIKGTIDMSIFKEYYGANIKKLQEELLHDCKESSSNFSERCIQNQRNAAKLELFSLLGDMNHMDEWIDWYRRYTDITPNPIIQPVNATIKPLLFKISSGLNVTLGDTKPMWILAMLAAKGSLSPIYVHGSHEYGFTIDPVIRKLATWFIGVNWEKKIIVIETGGTEIYDIKTDKRGYIEFTSPAPSIPIGKFPNTIVIDFGDNLQSTPKTHRFVTCLMMNYRPHDRHFGSLYLPLQYDWSDAHKLRRLQDFRAKHSKIACFAGSLVPPATISEITGWLDSSPDWAAVLIGWKWQYNKDWSENKDFSKLANYNQIIMIDKIEYEDLVQQVDFFITNCGAGSVAVAFAAGCPQQCGQSGAKIGADKGENNNAIIIHKVGPDWRNETVPFVQRMKEVDTKLAFYKANAQTAKKRMDHEYLHLWENMPKFFERLSSDATFQAQVLEEGIPDEYSLGMCPT